MKKIGIGLIGTGFMGKCHALAYRQVSAIFGLSLQPVLAHVVDTDLSIAAQFAKQYGFNRYSLDWRALLEDQAVDLIAVTTPNDLHEEICLAALSAGKHVHCEKPLALNAQSAWRMKQAAEKAGLKTMVGYNYLKSPAIQHAISLIKSGVIGSIYQVTAQYREDYLADSAKPFSWRCRKERAGSGALGDLGCHLISLLRACVGPIRSVMADTQIVISEREGGRVENEDQLQALVSFENGATGIFTTSRVGWGRKMGLEIELTGELGTLVFNQERMNELRLYTRPDADNFNNQGFKTILMGPEHPDYGYFCPAPGHGLGYNDLKIIEVKDLLVSIAEDRPSYPDFKEGYEIALVCDAMLRSSELGRRCELAALRGEHSVIDRLDNRLGCEGSLMNS
ncbi:MAG: Gfo/Idh/MocA family oxidoreductase [Gammaproteobacteria bacterium]